MVHKSIKKKKLQQEKRKSIPKEVQGSLYVGLSFFLLLSLFTFSPAQPDSNCFGIVGYYFSYLFIYTLGCISFLFPLFCIWKGVQIFLGKKSLSYLAMAIFILSSSFLANILAEKAPFLWKGLENFLLVEESVTLHDKPELLIRYPLGGIPTYFLYKDFPFFSLQRLFSDSGLALFSLFGLLISSFMLVEKRFFATVYHLCKQIPLSIRRGYSRIKEQKDKEKKERREREILFPKIAEKAKKNKEEPRKIPNKELSIQTTSTPIFKPPKKIKKEGYHLPSPNLLEEPKEIDVPTLKRDLSLQAETLEETLKSFGIEAKVVEINCGPTITSFEVQPPIGVKVQKIKTLENDIALNMEAKSIRILAPIPGKAVVGVEVPAIHRQEVGFKELLLYYQQKHKKMNIPVLLGKTVSGEYVLADLAKMPHCLIAGATGSGKSVCIQSIILSILMNASPNEVKLMLIDPKKVELTQYSNLPHMIAPVISEPHGAYAALHWLVKEMQHRYEILRHLGLRNINSFNNRKIRPEIESSFESTIPEKMHYIVGIIDEFADLMMVSSTDLETPIARIAQMARAVGIHLILATQRPSREVITGIIKANFPTRIAFKVSSRINSQIILDEVGAESLLGSGDLLFLPPGSSTLVRAQGAFVSDEEINKIIEDICAKMPTEYLISSFDAMKNSEELVDKNSEKDSLYDKAVQLVVSSKNASTTFLQRKLKIGYARAAGLMDQLEENGIVSPQDGSKARKVLASPQMLLEDIEE